MQSEVAEEAAKLRRRAEEAETARLKELEKQKAYAEMTTWITEYGSDRLKRGHAARYNMHRLYAVERGAHEAPGWTLDYDNEAGWDTRASPSSAALDLLDDAKKLGLGTPEIVWLTAPPCMIPGCEHHERDEDGEPNQTGCYADWTDPCEAVVLRNAILERDLVRIV